MYRLLFLLAGLLCGQIATAQFCGTNQEAIFPILEANLRSPIALERGAVKYVPITFHMVANAAGNGRVDRGICVPRVVELATRKARPLATLASAAVAEGAALSELLPPELDYLRVVGRETQRRRDS